MAVLSKPNFLIVGTPKGGTSSLFNYLKEHPEIYLPEQKELHFFSYNELMKNTNGPGDKLALANVIKSWEEYLSLYQGITTERMAGDVSPSYLYFSKEVIGRIKACLGENLKIIIMLRDPIERAYSNFMHQKRLMHETLTFNEALKVEKERMQKGYGDFWRYAGHSFYYEKCVDYIQTFGNENVKIVLFEDMVNRQNETISSIFKFLGVDDSFIPTNLNTVYNKGGVYKKNPVTKFLLKPSFIKEFMRKAVGNKIGRQYKQLKEKILNHNSENKSPIEQDTIKYLQAYFAEDVIKLKELVPDISKWRYFLNI